MNRGPQGAAEIAALLDRHGLRPRRSLGQHFLADPNIVRKIIDHAAIGSGDHVLEIGAGTGTLTRALAEAGASVVAFEVDVALRPILDEVVGDLESVRVRYEDAMEADLDALLGTATWKVVANLPYHVGTPLVLDLMQAATTVSRFVIMVQREVAERFTADPGSRRYGVPSVVAALYTERVASFRVGPAVFIPPPAVESVVVVLDRRVAVPAHASRAVALARVAFGGRRKMLRRSLAGEIDEPAALLQSAGIDPTSRAEDVPPEGYVALAAAEAQRAD